MTELDTQEVVKGPGGQPEIKVGRTFGEGLHYGCRLTVLVDRQKLGEGDQYLTYDDESLVDGQVYTEMRMSGYAMVYTVRRFSSAEVTEDHCYIPGAVEETLAAHSAQEHIDDIR